MGDVQIVVQVNVAGADQIKDLGTNLKDAGDNAKTAGSTFSSLGSTITGIVASIGLFSNGLFTLADAFDSVEKADVRLDKANKTVREALQKRDAIQADLNKSTQEGLTIEKTATGQLVTTIDGHKKLVATMQDGTLAVKNNNGEWQRLVTVTRDAKGNLIATDGTFRSLVSTLKDGSSVYTDAAGNLQVLDDGQKKSKFTVQDLNDANKDLNDALDRQKLAVNLDAKAHAELLPRLLSGTTQMVGGAAAAAQLGKDLVGMGGKAKSAGTDLDTHNKSLGTTLATMAKVAIPIAAAAAAYLLLKNNVGGSRDALEQLGQQLGQAVPALQPLLNVIGDIGRGLLGLGFGNLTQDLKTLQDQLAPIFNTLKQKFDEMSNAFQTFVQQIIRGDLSGALKTLVDSATKLGTDISNAIKSVDWSAVWQGLKDAFVSTLEWIKTSATNIGSAIVTGIKTTDWSAVWQGLKDAFNTTVETVKTAATTAGTAVMNAIKTVDWSAVWQGLKDAFTTTIDTLKTTATTIGTAISTAVKTFDWKSTGQAIGSAIMSAITFASDAAGTILTALGTAIINGVKTTDWTKVGTELGTDILNSIKWSDDIVSGIFDPLGKLIVDTTAKGIVNVSGNPLADALGQRIKDEITKIKLPSLQQIADDVWKNFTTALGSGNASTTGDSDLGKKIVARIQDAVNTIKDTDWSKVAGDLWNSFTKAVSSFFSGQQASAKGGGVTSGFTFLSDLVTPLNEITSKDWKIKISADTSAATQAVGGLQNAVTTITQQTYSLTISANTSQVQSDLGGIQNLVTTITQQTYTLTVTANLSQIQSDLGGIQNLVTTITQQTYTLTVSANTAAALQQVGGLQNAVTTITQQQYSITINANTAAALQQVGGLQNAVTTITQQQYTLTVNANVSAALSTLGGLQNTVTQIVGQNYTLTINANTSAALQQVGGLQNAVTQIVNQRYTITINVDTTAAEQKIASLRQQLASLNQGAVGGYPASPYGYPVAYGATGGTFSLDGGGFKKLHAAKGGSFITTKQMRLGNLTVGEGNRPELISFMPSRKGGKNASLLTVIPLPKFKAQGGGAFPVFGDFTNMGAMFPGAGFSTGDPLNYPGAPIDYGAGIPVPVQGQGGVPVTQLGQYGAPNFGTLTGGGGGAPFSGFGFDTGGGGQPQEVTTQQASMLTTSPYEMAQMIASATSREQATSGINPDDISHLISLIKGMIMRMMRHSSDVNVNLDGEKMASVVQKYLFSGSYGGR